MKDKIKIEKPVYKRIRVDNSEHLFWAVLRTGLLGSNMISLVLFLPLTTVFPKDKWGEVFFVIDYLLLLTIMSQLYAKDNSKVQEKEIKIGYVKEVVKGGKK